MEQQDEKFSFELLSKLFDQPLSEAAKELGICCTALKKICRKNGIQRWPYRTLKSINRTIEELESCAPSEKRDIELHYLKSKREIIFRNPSEEYTDSTSEKVSRSPIRLTNQEQFTSELETANFNKLSESSTRMTLPIKKKSQETFHTPVCRVGVEFPRINNTAHSPSPPREGVYQCSDYTVNNFIKNNNPLINPPPPSALPLHNYSDYQSQLMPHLPPHTSSVNIKPNYEAEKYSNSPFRNHPSQRSPPELMMNSFETKASIQHYSSDLSSVNNNIHHHNAPNFDSKTGNHNQSNVYVLPPLHFDSKDIPTSPKKHLIMEPKITPLF